MHLFTNTLTIFTLSALIYLSCESNLSMQQPGTSNPAESVARILESADTLSEASLTDLLCQLSPSSQDSFFRLRFLALDNLDSEMAVRNTLSIYDRLKPDSKISKGYTHYFKGIFHQNAGKFDSATYHFKYALSHFEETSDLMKTHLHLASVYHYTGDHDQANQWLDEPLKYYVGIKDTTMLAHIWGLKGSIYSELKNFPLGLQFHRKALALQLHSADSSSIVESFYQIGAILGRLGKWAESVDTLQIVERWLYALTKNQMNLPYETCLGEALYNLGRFHEAEYYLKKSLDHSLKKKQFTTASMAAMRLSAIRKDQNRYTEALELQELYVQLKDSIFDQEKQHLRRELSVQHQVQQKEWQISALKREHQLALQRNTLVLFMLLLTFGAAFYVNWKKSNLKAKKLAVKNARTEAHALNLEQVLEQHKSELEENRNRLDEYARMLMKKNRLTSQKMEDTASNPSTDKNIGQKNHDELYHLAILTEDDWERFQQYFSQVYPGYISQLRQKLPGLTPAEIRIILLGKLGLSLKETSAILGVSLDAVKKGRYRLKKKYHLDSDNFSHIIPYP